jgi:hypothetical protein
MNYFRKGFQSQLLLFDAAVVKSDSVVLFKGLPEVSVTPVVTLILYVAKELSMVLGVSRGKTPNVLLSLVLGLPLVI